MASKDDQESDGGRAISEIAALGGDARNKALTKQQKSEIARLGGMAKAAKQSGLPRETHSGILRLGSGIPCSVLSNGMRVFSVRGLFRAFEAGGKTRKTLESGAPLPEFLAAINLRPFISDELRYKLENTTE